MLTVLLIIIYISFISLGLPDSLLGSAWPAVHSDLGVQLSFAGVISMIVSCGTVISSLMSTRLIKRFGTGTVTLVSVGLTAAALLGFGFSDSAMWFCLLAVPLGLGAGSVDAALNNFVALHYKAMHMNWLHCFWGIGATSGPVIMAVWLAKEGGWRMGYRTIGLLQTALVLVLVLTLPLWKKASGAQLKAEAAVKSLPLRQVLRIPGAKPALLGFFCYCSLETTANLWASSFAVSVYGVNADTGAALSSLFFLGITLGRLVSGFVSIRIKTGTLIRTGEACVLCGVLLLLLPLPQWKLFLGICLVGIGCAPTFPSMLHRTPEVFGKDLSQAMMGVQMASAYLGSTFMPPLFGAAAGTFGLFFFPAFLLLLALLLVFCTERTTRRSVNTFA